MYLREPIEKDTYTQTRITTAGIPQSSLAYGRAGLPVESVQWMVSLGTENINSVCNFSAVVT